MTRTIAREICIMIYLENKIKSKIKNLLNNKELKRIKELIEEAKRYNVDVKNGYRYFRYWIKDLIEANEYGNEYDPKLGDLLDELDYYAPVIDAFMKYCGIKNYKLDINRLERVLEVLEN